MKSSKGNAHDEEEEYEEDFSSKKEGTSGGKDSGNNDKANAMRSKHSVTEQRRRSKINERFQILRELIPGDQKKDTASFLLEVIEYVQLLQEKVQKYEGSYQGWSSEPAKLMPWRHSHWRVQSFLGHPQAIKNGPAPAAFSGKYDERSVSINPSVTANTQTPGDADPSHDTFRALDQQSALGEKAGPMSTPMQVHLPTAIRNDGDTSHLPQRPASDNLSSTFAIRSDDEQGEHIIEGGTISISSAYSHGLLTTLTQVLQSSGVDLSQASISIRIDLGKRANQNLISQSSSPKEPENAVSHVTRMGHVRDGGVEEEFDQPQKKLRS